MTLWRRSCKIVSTTMAARVLVVEPNVGRRVALQRVLAPVADVAACADFVTARQHVRHATPDLLITNLRLETYNGLHLVAHAGPPTRAIVYMDPPDPGLLRVAQAAGAFVEAPHSLVAAAVSYVGAGLPPQDRRAVNVSTLRYSLPRSRRASDRIPAASLH
jgi:DNA-binding NarL/FixJ family response regulator